MPSDGESNEFRPTVLMARASLWLSEQRPANRTEIEQGVRHTGTKASNDALREALRLLVKEGYARESEGSGNAKPLQHVRLFTPQSADSPESAESPPRRGESAPPIRRTSYKEAAKGGELKGRPKTPRRPLSSMTLFRPKPTASKTGTETARNEQPHPPPAS